MSIGAKLFMLYLILGIGSNLADGWIDTFSHLTKLDITPFLEIAGGSLVYLFCALAIPQKAESLMSGATNATLGGLVAAASVASTAAGAAAGVARSVVGAGSAGMETIKQAHAIGQGLGGGVGGMLGGSTAAAFNLGASAIGSMIGRNSSTSDAMKQKTSGAKAFFAERAEKKAANTPMADVQPKTSPPSDSSPPTQSSS
jgi:type IV secretory pathway TrbL component